MRCIQKNAAKWFTPSLPKLINWLHFNTKPNIELAILSSSIHLFVCLLAPSLTTYLKGSSALTAWECDPLYNGWEVGWLLFCLGGWVIIILSDRLCDYYFAWEVVWLLLAGDGWAEQYVKPPPPIWFYCDMSVYYEVMLIWLHAIMLLSYHTIGETKDWLIISNESISVKALVKT